MILTAALFVAGCTYTPRATPLPPASPTSSPAASTPAGSPSPLATLPAEAARDRALEYLRDNNGCELPCWWGVTPGRTSFEEAERILAPVATSIRQGESSGGRTNYSVTYETGVEGADARTVYAVSAGVVDLIWVRPGGTETRYSLYQALSAYGAPDAVYAGLGGATEAPTLDLALFYPQLGALFRYALEAEEAGDGLRGCPQGVGPEIWLWDPARPRTAAELLGSDAMELLAPLEEAAGIGIDAFSLRFQDLSANACLELPG